MNIRLAKPEDLLGIQATNLQNLPENYLMKFWIYHAMTWPQISFVAEDHKGRIVGYVLAKIDDGEEDDNVRLGGMKAEEAMSTIYKASFISLHVRKSNKPAIALYRDALGFHVTKVEQKYYGDGEDALLMRLNL